MLMVLDCLHAWILVRTQLCLVNCPGRDNEADAVDLSNE